MRKYEYGTSKVRNKKKLYVKSAGLLSIFCGICLALYFFFPVISYHIFLSSAFSTDDIEVPIPKYQVLRNSGIGSLFSQGVSYASTDFTDARNWYPHLNTVKGKVPTYYLSIPKLKIENAEVSTTDYDLSKHLVHYAGTSNPGQKGTAVIFGHSTLPSWFNAKDYEKIFATLHTLKIGDEFTTTVKGNTYSYKIFSIEITTPEDTNILSQSYDNSYITLVTCTPPGTVWKRLVVRASLQGVPLSGN